MENHPVYRFLVPNLYLDGINYIIRKNPLWRMTEDNMINDKIEGLHKSEYIWKTWKHSSVRKTQALE